MHTSCLPPLSQTNQSTWYLKPRQNPLSEGSVLRATNGDHFVHSRGTLSKQTLLLAILKEARTFIQEPYKSLVAQGTKGRVYFLFIAFQRPPNGAVLGLEVMEHGHPYACGHIGKLLRGCSLSRELGLLSVI